MTDELYASTTKHWTGANHSLLGLLQVDGKFYHFMGQEPENYTTVLQTAEDANIEVQYTLSNPEGKWTSLDYTSTNWKTGSAPIGDNGEYKTKWTSDNIWVRRVFDLEGFFMKTLVERLQQK